MARRWMDYGQYVRVADRRKMAKGFMAQRTRAGERLEPVIIEGRKIAKSAWGIAWLDNLERYLDFANRLPRGRTYARRGAVLDLQLEPGQVRAVVQGTSRYRVQIVVSPLSAAAWNRIKADCAGSIDSVVELLAGKLARSVMARMCEASTGLFPEPREMKPSCTCPDAARLCKHVIAALCGIGHRLDSSPELLFRLRGVDERELVTEAVKGVARPVAPARKGRVIKDVSIAEVFGLEVAGDDDRMAEPGVSVVESVVHRRASKPASKAAAASARRHNGAAKSRRRAA